MVRILIADDAPLLRRLIRETLSVNPNLSFIEADNGFVALEQARLQHPELVILDMRMPAMNGFDVIRAIRADPELHATTIILIMGYGDPALAILGHETCALRFIKKPFTEQYLLSSVTEALQTPTR